MWYFQYFNIDERQKFSGNLPILMYVRLFLNRGLFCVAVKEFGKSKSSIVQSKTTREYRKFFGNMKYAKLSQTNDLMPTLGLGTWQVSHRKYVLFFNSHIQYVKDFILGFNRYY